MTGRRKKLLARPPVLEPEPAELDLCAPPGPGERAGDERGWYRAGELKLDTWHYALRQALPDDCKRRFRDGSGSLRWYFRSPFSGVGLKALCDLALEAPEWGAKPVGWARLTPGTHRTREEALRAVVARGEAAAQAAVVFRALQALQSEPVVRRGPGR